MRAPATLRPALAAGILCGLCWVTACALEPSIKAQTAPLPRAARPVTGSTTLYVVRRRWHVDVGFASVDLQGPLRAVTQQFPGARYLLFGFGDRHYLLAKHHGPPNLLAAIWPGPGLLLVTAIEGSPESAFGASQVVALQLTRDAAQRAQDFIWRSLVQSADGNLGPPVEGPYPGSGYFDAVPRYSGLYTCNTWAADALRGAGLPVRSTLTLLAGQLWSQVIKLATSSSHAANPRLVAGRGLPGDARFRDRQSQGGGLPFSQTTVVPLP